MMKYILPLILLMIKICLPDYAYSQDNLPPCIYNKHFKIVVLGSSTAAGKDASEPDSSWVNRYRNYLLGINNYNQVINLAQNGYTSYDLMPSTYNPPPLRPAPDTSNNITAAIAMHPDAIIVNLPSNDIANGYSVSEQLVNFDTMVNAASKKGIPVWICTPQPRYMTASAIRKQQIIKDALIARYGNYSIDFWNDIATSSGMIKSNYHAGDGAHLNDAGHATLFNKVLKKEILMSLYQEETSTDYICYAINPLKDQPDMETLLVFEIIIMNLGKQDGQKFMVSFNVYDLTSGEYIQKSNIQLEGLNTCESDTLRYTVHLEPSHQYLFKAYTSSQADRHKVNDTLKFLKLIIGNPLELARNFMPVRLILNTSSHPGDTVIWPDPWTGGNIIGTREIFSTSLASTHINKANDGSLQFDIVSHNKSIKSNLPIAIYSMGNYGLEISYCKGSHKARANYHPLWIIPLADTLLTYPDKDMAIISWKLYMAFNDTIGIRMQYKNGNVLNHYNWISPIENKNDQNKVLVKGKGYAQAYSKPFILGENLHKQINDGKTEQLTSKLISVLMNGGLLMQDPSIFYQEYPASDNLNILLELGDKFRSSVWYDPDHELLYLSSKPHIPLDKNCISMICTGYGQMDHTDTLDVEVIIDPAGFKFPIVGDMEVQPNPGSGKFLIRSSFGKRYFENIALSTYTGKKLKIGNIQWLDDKQLKMEVNVPESGIYLLTVSFEQNTYRIPIYIIK